MRSPSIQLFSVAVGFCVIGCAEAGSGNLDLLPGYVSGGDASTDGSERGLGGGSQAGLTTNARSTASDNGDSTVGGATSTSSVMGIPGDQQAGDAVSNASTPGGAGGSKAAGASRRAQASGGTASSAGLRTTGGSSSSNGTSIVGGTKASTGSGATSSNKKFCGNITTRGSVDTEGMKFSKYWDQITPENEGKWGSVQSTPSAAFNWRALDAVYDYAQKNNLAFKQHCFVWGSQQPSGTPTLAQVENWIKAFCQRYPNTKLIDVVNEPPPHTTPTYTKNLGAGESGTFGWITKAFKLARQYCPDAILILNDYNNIEYADQESHFIDIANQVKAAGGPIDAVGAQAHGIFSFSAATAQANIDKLASKTGLPVYITEFDVPKAADADQLAVFKALFPVFWNTPTVHGVTVWGWINGATWVKNTGLANGTTPRSALTWLMGYLDRPVPPN